MIKVLEYFQSIFRRIYLLFLVNSEDNVIHPYYKLPYEQYQSTILLLLITVSSEEFVALDRICELGVRNSSKYRYIHSIHIEKPSKKRIPFAMQDISNKYLNKIVLKNYTKGHTHVVHVCTIIEKRRNCRAMPSKDVRRFDILCVKFVPRTLRIF